MLYPLECPNFHLYLKECEVCRQLNSEYKGLIEYVEKQGGGTILGVYDLYELYFIFRVQVIIL